MLNTAPITDDQKFKMLDDESFLYWVLFTFITETCSINMVCELSSSVCTDFLSFMDHGTCSGEKFSMGCLSVFHRFMVIFL